MLLLTSITTSMTLIVTEVAMFGGGGLRDATVYSDSALLVNG